jgi:hypothetical protein
MIEKLTTAIKLGTAEQSKTNQPKVRKQDDTAAAVVTK